MRLRPTVLNLFGSYTAATVYLVVNHLTISQFERHCSTQYHNSSVAVSQLTQHAVLHYEAIITLYSVNQRALYSGQSHHTDVWVTTSI